MQNPKDPTKLQRSTGKRDETEAEKLNEKIVRAHLQFAVIFNIIISKG